MPVRPADRPAAPATPPGWHRRRVWPDSGRAFSDWKIRGNEFDEPDLAALFAFTRLIAAHQQVQCRDYIADGHVRVHTLRLAPGGGIDVADDDRVDHGPERAKTLLHTRDVVSGFRLGVDRGYDGVRDRTRRVAGAGALRVVHAAMADAAVAFFPISQQAIGGGDMRLADRGKILAARARRQALDGVRSDHRHALLFDPGPAQHRPAVARVDGDALDLWGQLLRPGLLSRLARPGPLLALLGGEAAAILAPPQPAQCLWRCLRRCGCWDGRRVSHHRRLRAGPGDAA